MGCGCAERRKRYRKARAAGKNQVEASLEMIGIKTRRRGEKKAAARAARAEEEARARRVAQEEEPEQDDERPTNPELSIHERGEPQEVPGDAGS
jgi:hypothetical protein